ncbi:HK97 gp10 family phage protein [Microbispora rosea]|uniref:HK97 gp10 family phage protein n=1 Tax=Microbispora rosea TaxID=58117 RepID=UPI0037A0EE6D
MAMSADLDKLIADFRKMPLDTRRKLRTEIRRVAAPVLSQVRSNAGWSSRIPAATTIKVGYSKSKSGATIVTSARKAPHARPYEHDGVPGTFRHPVNRPAARRRKPWVSQAARPFFYRAVSEAAPKVEDGFRELIMRVARENGWK